MKNLWFILLAISLIGMTCTDDATSKNKSEEITLKTNEVNIIPNSNNAMSASLIKVADNRCAKSMCDKCFGSKADISLSISNSESAKVIINLAIVGCVDEISNNPDTYPWGEGVDTLGYKFQLVKLSPYPDVNSINENDYVAKIKITKL